jgi:ribosomal 50S subunit-recycling heat shock protein
MRLDKFLKVSRLIKRRPVAKEVADKGRVQVNGKIAKSATALKTGDLITIRFGNKIVEAKVLDLREHVRKEEADKMYEIVRETRLKGDVDGPTDE